MAQQGGYRKPENPAPSSGPGALSRRTDGGPAQGAKYMSGMPYGENTMAQQTAAPMSGGSPMPSAPAVSMPMPTPLMAPTSRPNEPITSGINLGDGVGSEAMQLPNTTPTILEILKTIAANDPSGDTELLYRTLEDSGY
jgi:hypothetical protein